MGMRAVRGSRVCCRHRRRRPVRRVHRQRLPGGHPGPGAVRQPDLVRVDSEPCPACRADGLGNAPAGRARCDRAVRHRGRGVRATRHRCYVAHPHTEPAAHARRPSRADGPGDRPESALDHRMGSRDRAVRSGHRWLGQVVHRRTRQGDRFPQAPGSGVPRLRHQVRGRLAPTAVRGVRDGPRRARGRNPRLDLGLRRNVGTPRVPSRLAAVADALGHVRRCRDHHRRDPPHDRRCRRDRGRRGDRR